MNFEKNVKINFNHISFISVWNKIYINIYVCFLIYVDKEIKK